MSHPPLQAYTSATVSSSVDVWAFGIIATKVFLGRNLDEQKRDVRGHGSCMTHNDNDHMHRQMCDQLMHCLRTVSIHVMCFMSSKMCNITTGPMAQYVVLTSAWVDGHIVTPLHAWVHASNSHSYVHLELH